MRFVSTDSCAVKKQWYEDEDNPLNKGQCSSVPLTEILHVSCTDPLELARWDSPIPHWLNVVFCQLAVGTRVTPILGGKAGAKWAPYGYGLTIYHISPTAPYLRVAWRRALNLNRQTRPPRTMHSS